MIHEQMSDYYDFLNLHGFKRCHEYHAKCEMKNMRKLHRYYLNHFNKLIEEERIEDPSVIPNDWYRYTRQEVDATTKRNAVRDGIEKWVAWEHETKDLYESMYIELIDLGEVAASEALSCFIKDVDRELKWAERSHINLVSADYSISYIMGLQDYWHDWYKKRMHK